MQDRLREEIRDAAKDKRISYEDLMDMPYLDQVIYESLRMNPPLTFSNRQCSESLEVLSVKGHKVMIEEGMSVFIPILSIHHDQGLRLKYECSVLIF